MRSLLHCASAGRTGGQIASCGMVPTTFVLLFLLLVVSPSNGGTGWQYGQLVYGDDWPSRVYEEAETMDHGTVQLDESVSYVHQYLVNMITAAQKAENETDVWKKRALLRIVQNRLEELRIGRKEVKKALAEHRQAVEKVEKHAKKLKKKLPLWHDGIARKLKRAREAITRAKHWLESEKKIVKSEEAQLAKMWQNLNWKSSLLCSVLMTWRLPVRLQEASAVVPPV